MLIFFDIGMVEARQLGFFLNPGPQYELDDRHEQVQAYLPDFTLYGSEFRTQRERDTEDPHVIVNPPSQNFLTEQEVT